MALIWDVVEGNNGDVDDTVNLLFKIIKNFQPFMEAIYKVFLTISTNGICGERRPIPFLLYLFSIFGIALLQSLINLIQKIIERKIGRYELAFSQRVGQVEQVLSSDCLNEQIGEDNDNLNSKRKISVHFNLDSKDEKFEQENTVYFTLNQFDNTEEIMEDIEEEEEKEEKSEYQSLIS